jgi:hypothetical protein
VSSSSDLQNARFFGSVSIDSFAVKSSGLARMPAMMSATTRRRLARSAELVVHLRLEARELVHVAREEEHLSGVEVLHHALEGLLRDAVVDGRAEHVLLQELGRRAREDGLARIPRRLRRLLLDDACGVGRRGSRRR